MCWLTSAACPPSSCGALPSAVPSPCPCGVSPCAVPVQAGAKQAPEVEVDPQQVQDVIIWSSHTFLQVRTGALPLGRLLVGTLVLLQHALFPGTVVKDIDGLQRRQLGFLLM